MHFLTRGLNPQPNAMEEHSLIMTNFSQQSLSYCARDLIALRLDHISVRSVSSIHTLHWNIIVKMIAVWDIKHIWKFL